VKGPIMDWQPIETAPKDGRRLFLGRFKEDSHNDYICIGHYSPGDAPDIPDEWWDDHSDDGCTPTHWLPYQPPKPE